jgi:hypothetical protein
MPRLQVIWSITWCAIGIPLGFMISNYMLSRFNFKYDYNSFSVTEVKKDSSKYFEIFWILIIALYTIYTIYKIGFIPHFQAIDWSPEKIALFRGEMTHNFPASVHLKELIGIRVAPIISFYYFAKLISEKTMKSLVCFSCLLLISCLFLTINLNKSNISIYLIGLVITFGLTKRNIQFKQILVFILLTFILLFGSYALTKKIYNTKKIGSAIYSRIAYSQSYGNYLSFHVFPNLHPHIGFKSTSRLVEKLGLEYSETSARLMMRIVDPPGIKNGKAGFQVSTFFAEAWANWGLAGVILSPLLVGIILKLLIGILINLPKTYLSCALITYISYSLQISSGINNIIFPRYLIIIFILFFLTHKISKGLIKFKTKNQ